MSRTVEIFSAGCGMCESIIHMANRFACHDCVVTVHDTHDSSLLDRVKHLGARSLPALVVDGVYIPPDPQEGYTEAIFESAGMALPKPKPVMPTM
jgi:glutaredoxin 3